MRLRKNGQPDRRCKYAPGYTRHPGNSARQWNPERHARWLALQSPDPEHVRHLREGIDLFRRMLEARAPRDEYSSSDDHVLMLRATRTMAE